MPEIDDVIFDQDSFFLEMPERKPEYSCLDCPAAMLCSTEPTELYVARCPSCGEAHWATIGFGGGNVDVEEFGEALECGGLRRYENNSARCESCEWEDKMSKD